jgi:hypothetical protein
MAKKPSQKQIDSLEAAILLANAPIANDSTLAQLRLERMKLALELKATTDFIDTQLALLHDEFGIGCQCKQCSTLGET